MTTQHVGARSLSASRVAVLVLLALAACAPEPAAAYGTRGDRCLGGGLAADEIERWRRAIDQAAGATPGITSLSRPRQGRPCYSIGILADSVRPRLEMALRAHGVATRAVTIPIHVVRYLSDTVPGAT